MALNEYAIRFSEDKYLTKNEVAKEMKMSIIDTIWSSVLNYRSGFYHYLPLRSIDRSSLYVCLCLSVQGKIMDANKELNHLLDEQAKLSTVNGDSQYFTLTSYVSFLKTIKNFRQYALDENTIKDLINGKRMAIDESERHLANYYASLRFIEKNCSKNIDESFLADLYAVLTGQDELTYFYRVNEDNSSANKILIDRLYHSAPVSLVEPMMNALFNFINESNIDIVAKALITYYYIDYIKPFTSYNEEVAILLAKAVLSHSSIGVKAVLFDLESLINEKEREISKYNEVQKTQDITYFLIYALDYVVNKVKKNVDAIYEYSSTAIKEDYYRPEEVKQEEAKIVEPEPIKEEPVPEAKVEIKPILKEEPKPVVVKEVKREEIKQEIPSELAISFIPPALDEKVAARLTTHLLECDPNLKKGEAYFYARHCTLGKIYTIQQYKKCVGCVYETARTSMDHLKELGYYQESMIKNKKVYTPIKR